MTIFETLEEAARPSEPIWQQQLEHGVEQYAGKLFKERLDQLYYPTMYVLPITPEGEEHREWLMNYHHDSSGRCCWTSILRYGCDEVEFRYKGETYIALLVNND